MKVTIEYNDTLNRVTVERNCADIFDDIFVVIDALKGASYSEHVIHEGLLHACYEYGLIKDGVVVDEEVDVNESYLC
jgi:hypothetical protein